MTKVFPDKSALMDGITRDVISLFYSELYCLFEGANDKVSLPNIYTEELEIVKEKLLMHLWCLSNTNMQKVFSSECALLEIK